MNIVHLGFEDHRRPGSGGGSFRNHQVNRRLVAAGNRVEVVTAGYPGAKRRLEDGVLYRHAGIGREYFTSILSYHALLLPVVLSLQARRNPPDLIVEEFAPPWSTFGVTRATSIPTVGMVQGFFASEKAQEYRVPRKFLVGLQRWGTRAHHNLIALSEDLAAQLRQVAPAARVHVVGMGVAQDEIGIALATPQARVPGRIVYLGRLEVAQKGLDLLFDACADVLAAQGAHLVLAGDGRDAAQVADLIRATGITEHVSVAGRVSGVEKWRLLASAQLSVVPSRYETFGLSALEALACGTPVLGFNIRCLRETVPLDAGRLVEPFRRESFRDSLVDLLADPRRCAEMGERGRQHANGYSWDAVAERQLDVYREAVAGARRS